MSHILILYDYPRSSASFRVRIALNYKKIAYEKRLINLLDENNYQDEYVKINPVGLVPCLVTGNGKFIQQSLAIIDYLEEQFPETAKLLPNDILERSYVRSIALDIACDIHPLNNLRVLKYLKEGFGHNQHQVDQWYQHWISIGLMGLEEKISQSEFYSGTFCCGNQFTLADVCLIPQLYNARRFNCDLSLMNTLLAIEKYCLSKQWVNDASPEIK